VPHKNTLWPLVSTTYQVLQLLALFHCLLVWTELTNKQIIESKTKLPTDLECVLKIFEDCEALIWHLLNFCSAVHATTWVSIGAGFAVSV
jgi:hypothetical protein